MDTPTTVNPVELPALPVAPPGRPGSQWLIDRREVLKGVSVKVQAVLGSAEVMIGKLMAMQEGEVLGLDQDAHSPVDLYVEGHLVGRGELVVIGENYGVRITELSESDAR